MADGTAARFATETFSQLRPYGPRPGRCFDCFYEWSSYAGELCYRCEIRLRDELNIPDDWRLLYGRVPGHAYGRRWRRWRVDVIYSIRPQDESEASSREVVPLLVGDRESLAYLWRQVVNRRGSPLHIVRHWIWDRGPTVELHGLESTRKSADVTAAMEGASLFLDVNRRGRPRGSVAIAGLRRKVRTTYRDIASKNTASETGRRPTKKSVADALDVDVRTLTNQMQSLGISWPPE